MPRCGMYGGFGVDTESLVPLLGKAFSKYSLDERDGDSDEPDIRICPTSCCSSCFPDSRDSLAVVAVLIVEGSRGCLAVGD